jgi:endonuclease/exonuclease/phosphatase family metal-dependent hydrolase
MATESNACAITVCTWNVQYSRICTAPDTKFPQFQWRARRPIAMMFLAELATMADVLMLQEVRSENLAEITALLTSPIGITTGPPPFRVFTQQYGKRADSNGCRDFLVLAVRTPGPAVHVRPPGTDEQVKALECALLMRVGDTVFGSVHFPMDKYERMHTAQALGAVLGSLPQETQIVLAGDYNAFPDDGAAVQLQTLHATAGLHDATQFLVRNSDGRRATSTFRPYPFDCVPALPDQDKLDYVCVRRCVAESAVCIDDMPTACRYGGRSYGPSDHFPVLVTLRTLAATAAVAECTADSKQ